jgi:hypothetical protein
MIIFKVCDGEYNILQLVIGPQTDYQLDLEGLINLDLEELIDSFQYDLPFKLVISRSNDEVRTMEMTQRINGGNSQQHVVIKKDTKNNQNDDYDEDETVEYYYDDPRGEFIKGIPCPLCKADGVFLKKGQVPICADCLKIELGLGNVKIPKKEESNEEKPKPKPNSKNKKEAE